MFAALFNRAQVTVDNAIGQALTRIVMAAPFVVAAAFGTAAATLWLSRVYGAEAAYMILAAAYVVVGFFIMGVLWRPSPAVTASAAPEAVTAAATEDARVDPALSAADRELVAAAVTAIAPLAAPTLVPLLLRNLPLIALVLAVGFMVLRGQSGDASSAATPEPPPAAA
jgi:hypothetical protein